MGSRTKLLQIFLMLGAGALAGTLVTRLWMKPYRPVRKAVVATAAPSIPVSVSAPAVPVPQPTSPSPAPPAPAKKVARKLPPSRPSHPAAKPAPVVLAKAKPEPTPTPPPPVSPPPPLSIPPVVRAETPIASKPENNAPQLPTPHRVTLYTGLLIPVRLVEALSSETSKAGDTFTATVDQEIIVDGFVIVERGMPVDGVVTAVDRVAALITVELTRLYTADRQRVAIQTDRFEHRPGPPAATLPAKTRIQFRLRTSIQLTEKLG